MEKAVDYLMSGIRLIKRSLGELFCQLFGYSVAFHRKANYTANWRGRQGLSARQIICAARPFRIPSFVLTLARKEPGSRTGGSPHYWHCWRAMRRAGGQNLARFIRATSKGKGVGS